MKSQAVRGVSTLLFFAESNYGGSSRAEDAYAAVMEWARRKPFSVRGILAHDRECTRPGFWLDDRKKERMAMEMAHYLENNRLALAEGFVAPLLGPDAAKDKLFKQLSEYEKRFKESVTRSGDALEDGRMPYKYSGKTSSDSDDVVLITQEALLMMVYLQGGHLRFTAPAAIYRAPMLDPRFRSDGTIEDAQMAEFERSARTHSKRSYLFDSDVAYMRSMEGPHIDYAAVSKHDMSNEVDHDTGEQLERTEQRGNWVTFDH